MPRLMSFAMTTAAMKDRSKTVTRRLGWHNLKPGTLVWAVEKSMGLKKGEKVVYICLIRIVDNRREPLTAITDDDVEREGFPGRSRMWFVERFVDANGCPVDEEISRIEFQHVQPVGVALSQDGEKWLAYREEDTDPDEVVGVDSTPEGAIQSWIDSNEAQA